ncbi:Hsp70 family protein [Streptomyces sp. NPDC096132]|uniref:Hsp70 family protein n=1 Tax=Streptomyces sp. NPDC096132 TaxID=3366075 RepID=UPI003825ADBC
MTENAARTGALPARLLSLLADDTPEGAGEREENILAVDFGTSTTRAVLVAADGRDRVVKDPVSGSWRWASAVFADDSGLRVGAAAQTGRHLDPSRYLREFKRLLGPEEPVRLGGLAVSCTDLVAHLLATVREQALTLLPAGSRLSRAVVTVPAGYAPEGIQWAAMLRACRRAGFEDTELLPEPVAAALGSPPLDRPGAAATVLVYDLGGGTFDTALLRYDAQPDGGRARPVPQVLGHDGLDACGGRDIDGALTRWLRQTCAPWLEPLLADTDPAAPARTLALTDFARTVKHQLSGVDAVRDRPFPDSPPVSVTRECLAGLSEPLIARTVECCRALLHRCDTAPDDITHVLLTGGGSRMPAVRSAVHTAWRRRPHQTEDPDLAVVLGARLWAARQPLRRLTARTPSPGTEALSWHIPGGSARLERWLRAPGDAYDRGTALARVRLSDGSLHDLTAASPGRLLRRQVAPAQRVADGDWLVTSRRPPRAAELPAVPPTPAEPDVPGPVLAVAWSPDARRLHAAGDGWMHSLDASSWTVSAPYPEAGRGRFLGSDAGGLHIAVVTRKGEPALVDADAPTPPRGLGAAALPTPVPGPLACGPRGLLAVALDDAAVHLCRLRTGGGTGETRVVRIPADGGPGPSARIRGLAFDSEGRRLTAVSRLRRTEGRITTWRVDDGELLADLRLDTPVERVASGGGRLAVTGPGGGATSPFGPEAVVWLWEPGETAATRLAAAHGPELSRSLLARRGHGHAPAVAFGPDGLLLAEGGQDATVRLWDVRRRSEVCTYPAGGVVHALAFSPDGLALAVGTDRGLTVWALDAVPGRRSDERRSPTGTHTDAEQRSPTGTTTHDEQRPSAGRTP